jgi:DNA-3-methyladenine glycosylase
MSDLLEVADLGDDGLSTDVVEAAQQLLGCRLSTAFDGVRTEVVVIETEAYGGADDPASHAYRGRTERNAAMYAAPGTLYVYRSYGVHWCANVVTGPVGEASAVLIRGGVPVAGVERMQERRGRVDHLADGPGKLCAALGITGAYDSTSLEHGPVLLMSRAAGDSAEVETAPRIGITRAVDRLWRFVARGIDGSSLAPT